MRPKIKRVTTVRYHGMLVGVAVAVLGSSGMGVSSGCGVVPGSELLHDEDGVDLSAVGRDPGLTVEPVEEEHADRLDVVADVERGRLLPRARDGGEREASHRAARVGELDDHSVAGVVGEGDVEVLVGLVLDDGDATDDGVRAPASGERERAELLDGAGDGRRRERACGPLVREHLLAPELAAAMERQQERDHLSTSGGCFLNWFLTMKNTPMPPPRQGMVSQWLCQSREIGRAHV